MKSRKESLMMKFVFIILTACVIVASTGAQTPLKVCPDPAAPCRSKHKSFEKYELSFTLPKVMKPNVAYTSTPFYAVVLKSFSDPECDEGEYSSNVEQVRLQAQRMFPGRKVFADNQCPDMGAVSYSLNKTPNSDVFVAVYAGETQAEAAEVLAKAKEKYPKARQVRMQASFERIEQ
jgi:hypothetical protein